MSDDCWWKNLPPCSRCGVSHVLIDCRARLWFELGSPLETED